MQNEKNTSEHSLSQRTLDNDARVKFHNEIQHTHLRGEEMLNVGKGKVLVSASSTARTLLRCFDVTLAQCSLVCVHLYVIRNLTLKRVKTARITFNYTKFKYNFCSPMILKLFMAWTSGLPPPEIRKLCRTIVAPGSTRVRLVHHKF